MESTGKAGLVQLGKDAGKRGWWTAYSDVFTGSYIALETEATAIQTWEPILVPGLLQSEGYAREIICAARPELTAEEVDRHVDARMARKINLLTTRTRMSGTPKGQPVMSTSKRLIRYGGLC
ncbi:hypothetical protein DI270_004330 [Microbispora triticiradicis]|uniref:DUF5753 domain-containing protein n=1 Tax=Microbispora triticiradicis TaxID=2200763 RepID=A0ABX9LQV2_9ACTN|nr:hypothetical protein DI270_004330 [Microbispora triticiradicis]GLW20800.1 hypothetical protein Mame01_08430 [Microbispora amethystogenes]